MAVHGTRRRESVSWDYGGLLQLFGSLITERTRLPGRALGGDRDEPDERLPRLRDHDLLPAESIVDEAG